MNPKYFRVTRNHYWTVTAMKKVNLIMDPRTGRILIVRSSWQGSLTIYRRTDLSFCFKVLGSMAWHGQFIDQYFPCELCLHSDRSKLWFLDLCHWKRRRFYFSRNRSGQFRWFYEALVWSDEFWRMSDNWSYSTHISYRQFWWLQGSDRHVYKFAHFQSGLTKISVWVRLTDCTTSSYD